MSDKNGTSQICPQCQTHIGKKSLSLRIHKCPECGYEVDRNVAAAQVVVQRGLAAVGLPSRCFQRVKSLDSR